MVFRVLWFERSFLAFGFYCRERASGGPEAADFSDRLSLGSSKDSGCGRGALLAQACQDFPSIRSCYLTHCSLARASLLASQALYRGELQRVPGLLLPLPKEPLLPTDWPFLPLIHLYHQASDTPSGLPPADTVGTALRALQWVLVLESWRPQALWAVPPAARLARLMCVFLVDSELFRETPIQHLVAALLARLCQPQVLRDLKLDCPLPGLASFPDLYASFLEHFEAVSYGDHLFGALVLLPLQRRFSVALRLALFGEHVGALRALGLPLTQVLSQPSRAYHSLPVLGLGDSPEQWGALVVLRFLILPLGDFEEIKRSHEKGLTGYLAYSMYWLLLASHNSLLSATIWIRDVVKTNIVLSYSHFRCQFRIEERKRSKWTSHKEKGGGNGD